MSGGTSPATVLATLGRLLAQLDSVTRNGELWLADAGSERPPWTDAQRAELAGYTRRFGAIRAALAGNPAPSDTPDDRAGN